MTDPLTPRERELWDLRSKGLTARQISERVFLSEHTIFNYWQAARRKLLDKA